MQTSMTDDYLSVYDDADQLEDRPGRIGYMQLNRKSVGVPHYEQFQQHRKNGKPWQNIQRKLKRITVAVVFLGILLFLVIATVCILLSIIWIKFNQSICKQEVTSLVQDGSDAIQCECYFINDSTSSMINSTIEARTLAITRCPS